MALEGQEGQEGQQGQQGQEGQQGKQGKQGQQGAWSCESERPSRLMEAVPGCWQEKQLVNGQGLHSERTRNRPWGRGLGNIGAGMGGASSVEGGTCWGVATRVGEIQVSGGL